MPGLALPVVAAAGAQTHRPNGDFARFCCENHPRVGPPGCRIGRGGGGASGCLCRVKREVEGGALVDGAFGPDAAAVAFDDPLDAGQADAGAGELGDRVQPLERLEQLAGEGGVEAGPVVADVVAGSGAPGSGGAAWGGAGWGGAGWGGAGWGG